MKKPIRLGVIAVTSSLLTLLVCTPSLCCYSGLLVIPTASTVGENQYSCELQADGVVQGLTTNATLFNSEIGLGKRWELGGDIDFENSNSRFIGNAKYVAYGSDSGPLAIAVGVAGVANYLRPTFYTVANIGTEKTHLHLGTMRIEGSNRLIAGLDRHLGKFTLMGDYTSGTGGLSSFGFNYQVNDNFGVMAGALFPNDSSDTGFTLHLVWCTPFGGSGR